MSLLVCSALCYAQEDDPFGLYEKGASRTKKYDLEKEYKVKEKSLAPFVGINLGIGGDFGKGFSTLEGTIGLDVAGSINDRFAMGCYFSYQTITAVSLGLLFVHGNHNNGSAFLWGIGYSSPELLLRDNRNLLVIGRNCKISPNLRLGFALKNGLYFMTDMEASRSYIYEDFYRFWGESSYRKFSFDINFRVGWKFNLNKKK